MALAAIDAIHAAAKGQLALSHALGGRVGDAIPVEAPHEREPLVLHVGEVLDRLVLDPRNQGVPPSLRVTPLGLHLTRALGRLRFLLRILLLGHRREYSARS